MVGWDIAQCPAMPIVVIMHANKFINGLCTSPAEFRTVCTQGSRFPDFLYTGSPTPNCDVTATG